MTSRRKYLYGPVPSRRLGLSLGVDIVPFKVCTLDCVYCQLGRTVELTSERKDFGPVKPVLAELRDALVEGAKADFLTIGGSGEPTLHLRLGELVDGIKKITDVPVALLTNGTLFHRPDVRADCALLDVAMPSLDAGDERTFQRIDRPEQHFSVEKVISGLCSFREEFSGKIWLEVFLVRSINTDPTQIASLSDAIERIRPDKVQLNTAVRPTADPKVARLTASELERIAVQLGPRCEVVADFPGHRDPGTTAHVTEDEPKASEAGICETGQTLLSMLKRRPCSIDDIVAGLSLSRGEASKHLADLQDRGLIQAEAKGGHVFFKSTS